MDELREYIAPPVKKQTDIKKVLAFYLKSIEIIRHGILPHKLPEDAKKKIIPSYLTGDDALYTTSMEIYKESKERIQHLEEKAFKLLTYISAISAILFFFLGSELEGPIKALVITAIGLLVIAMIISLRCIGAKTQKAIFIDTIIKFDSSEVAPKSKPEITAEIINCAVYNQTVADNTADILKASSHILSLGIIATVVSFIVFFSSTKSPKEPQNVNVTFSDTTFLESVKNSLRLHNQQIQKVDSTLSLIKILETQSNAQLDTLNVTLEKISISAHRKLLRHKP